MEESLIVAMAVAAIAEENGVDTNHVIVRSFKEVQKSGLEWIYRIIQEPGRLWRRYAYGLVKFSWLSLLHVLGKYRGV